MTYKGFTRCLEDYTRITTDITVGREDDTLVPRGHPNDTDSAPAGLHRCCTAEMSTPLIFSAELLATILLEQVTTVVCDVAVAGFEY